MPTAMPLGHSLKLYVVCALLALTVALTTPQIALSAPGKGGAAVPAQFNVPPAVGIADQHPELFTDPLFVQAGITHARLLVGWNGIYDDAQRKQMDDFLYAAKAQNIDVLITFGNSRANGRDRPTPDAFRQAFHQVRIRYPWVTEFATWNEPNLQGAKPELTARYWRALRHDCPTCTLLAADMVDTANMRPWITRFRKAAKLEPKYWGLHNYVDANTFRTAGTRAIVAVTKGEIWLTETGGVVERHNTSAIVFATGSEHAAAAVRFIFNRLVPTSPRIRRVYLYNWRASPGPSTWDSALTSADGTPRPAYIELRSQLQRFGVFGTPAAIPAVPEVPAVPPVL